MSEKPSEKPLQKNKNGNKTRKTILGPVPSLEEHVRPDWWRCIFNSYYLKTDADVVDDVSITRSEIDMFLEILKLNPEDRVLDLCCGQGRHTLELARRGFRNCEGLDRSHYLVQRAKTQARKENLPVRFREGDARKLPYLPDSFDAILILGNSFGYFDTINDDLLVLKEVFRVLKPGGKLLIDCADGDYLRNNYQPRSWEWIGKKMFVCRERELSADGQRLISREVITHINKGVVADQFYGERLYTRDSMTGLLKEAGFSESTFHRELFSSSRRNQDLGMMERRIIITAVCKKEWTQVKKRSQTPPVKNVAVIMGDPTKIDPVKVASFDPEDNVHTVEVLKKALKELKDYQFIFLNNHDTLVSDIFKLPGKVDFVMNLCDEGYFNDPTRELFIPVFLEAANLYYTGSSPSCLAQCYDKSLVRGVAREMGIPVPRAFFVKPEDTAFELPFGFPVIVKPNFGDSSWGITQRSVASNLEELIEAISEIRGRFGYDKPLLVEEFLTGKDLSVGIIGNLNGAYTVLPITEDDYSSLPEGLPKICGYEAKWCPHSPYWNIRTIPAELPEETEKMLVEYSMKLFERFDCRDYARFDWRLDSEGNPRLLEVNPNPGWCWDGHLARMAKFAGLEYHEMLDRILKTAETRFALAQQSLQTRGKEELYVKPPSCYMAVNEIPH